MLVPMLTMPFGMEHCYNSFFIRCVDCLRNDQVSKLYKKLAILGIGKYHYLTREINCDVSLKPELLLTRKLLYKLIVVCKLINFVR